MISLNNLYIQYIGLLIVIATVGTLIIAVAHYIAVGPNAKSLGKLKPEIQRFNFLEISSHFLRMASTIILAITGIAFAVYNTLGLSYQFLLHIHLFFAALFALSSVVSILIWMKDNTFKKYDWEWLKVMGGYLTKKEIHVPAGKFNAGQKLFFWLTTFLSIFLIFSGYLLTYPAQFSVHIVLWASIIHGVSAVTLIAVVIGHAYLGSFANPGTIGTITHGMVAKEWIKLHHPKCGD
ncbi:formate dehydrogenase subunit gamma [Desulforamulus aeronauticus]|uniref:Formate dehydrogenase, gamma subunit n=1 Tax=Desulforamulus aeronauticus DSM 10349 TaxID=1121421 RepID=A0A1M6PH80_9FIRM|nr:formate dehydrogenase subunit gamma [Desulforamulus aeronauticus]SHK07299.1 formate dehydrogenase, gamma subunit [Desulforamulus aeronauticus DSM 10349]